VCEEKEERKNPPKSKKTKVSLHQLLSMVETFLSYPKEDGYTFEATINRKEVKPEEWTETVKHLYVVARTTLEKEYAMARARRKKMKNLMSVKQELMEELSASELGNFGVELLDAVQKIEDAKKKKGLVVNTVKDQGQDQEQGQGQGQGQEQVSTSTPLTSAQKQAQLRAKSNEALEALVKDKGNFKNIASEIDAENGIETGANILYGPNARAIEEAGKSALHRARQSDKTQEEKDAEWAKESERILPKFSS